MSIFDLLFICVFLASVVTLAAIVVRIAMPLRVLAVGDTRCSDDWCVTVTGAQRSETAEHSEYTVGFRPASRALRVAQREKGLACG